MLINADLHIHSPYSGGTSDKINLKSLAEGARKKGLHLLATGDCLHDAWIEEIKKGSMEEGIIKYNGMNFILTTEIEDENRVHHLLIFPDFDSVNCFKKIIEKKCKDCNEGRPTIMMNGSAVSNAAISCNDLIGPAHAFTPWTSLYAYFDSISYYGMKPHFLELGLSADSNYADRIAELNSIPFLSNSDSHSAMPHRLGREFNIIDVEEITWDAISKAILKGRITNVGVPPEKGKYNKTACTSCYRQYTIEEATKLKWKCYCGGVIKKGVRDRVNELATFDAPHHPEWRGKYIYMLPLAEIISYALNMPIHSAIVKKRWNELTRKESEIDILLNVDINEIKKITPIAIANAIEAFREGKIKIKAGGGGKYGEILIEEGIK